MALYVMSHDTPALETLGWNPVLAKAFIIFSDKNLIPARVVAEHRSACEVVCAAGSFLAEVSGLFRRAAKSKADFPAVGDWAALSFEPRAKRQTIQALLPRSSKLSRRDPGGEEEQVIAANIDAVFIVQSLDGNYNLNRLERYLAAVTAGGASAVVLLNKADLDPDAALKADEVRSMSSGAPVLPLDSINKTGYDALNALLTPGRAVVLAGSSGSGKSTIINNLMGAELQRTASVREEDARGRHTTTGRKLFILPGSGALLIDTPGMRGLELWKDAGAADGTFDDIRALAERCRFGNCSHSSEPDCSVREALEAGTLPRAHYENYLKLRKEAASLKTKTDHDERLKRKGRADNSGNTLKDASRRRQNPLL